MDALRIGWYLGFGWLPILAVVLCGIGINHIPGAAGAALYVPFLAVAVYMTVRFRLFSQQAWRRVHARTMIAYGRLAAAEYEAAGTAGRPLDVAVPCRALGAAMFGPGVQGEIESLLGPGRKAYYRALAEDYPAEFAPGAGPERQGAVLDGVRRDIDASELGPDILVARKLEQKHGRLEAARYLRALLLGEVR